MDLTIPYSALAETGDGAYALHGTASPAPVAHALLLETVRRAAEAAAGAPVACVSSTTDYLKSAYDGLVFSAEIDRKTRTLVFAHGEARTEAGPVLSATCVFKILGG